MRYVPKSHEDFKRLNVRQPDHDWILVLIVTVLFGIGLIFGYCFFHAV